MSPARDHRRSTESWPSPYTSSRRAQPPRIAAVSLAAPPAAWTAEARCAGLWEVFDPSPADETRSELNARVAKARRVCERCQVMAECRTFARTASPPVVGIYGGVYYSPNTSRKERRQSS